MKSWEVTYRLPTTGTKYHKAVVEADLESGRTKGAGLNEGILYLMATPYLAMLCFGIFYTIQKRKKNQTA